MSNPPYSLFFILTFTSEFNNQFDYLPVGYNQLPNSLESPNPQRYNPNLEPPKDNEPMPNYQQLDPFFATDTEYLERYYDTEPPSMLEEQRQQDAFVQQYMKHQMDLANPELYPIPEKSLAEEIKEEQEDLIIDAEAPVDSTPTPQPIPPPPLRADEYKYVGQWLMDRQKRGWVPFKLVKDKEFEIDKPFQEYFPPLFNYKLAAHNNVSILIPYNYRINGYFTQIAERFGSLISQRGYISAEEFKWRYVFISPDIKIETPIDFLEGLPHPTNTQLSLYSIKRNVAFKTPDLTLATIRDAHSWYNPRFDHPDIVFPPNDKMKTSDFRYAPPFNVEETNKSLTFRRY